MPVTWAMYPSADRISARRPARIETAVPAWSNSAAYRSRCLADLEPMTASRASSPSASRIDWINSTVRSPWRSGNKVSAPSARRHLAAGRPRPPLPTASDGCTRPEPTRSSRCWRTAVEVTPKASASSVAVAPSTRLRWLTILRLVSGFDPTASHDSRIRQDVP